MSQNQEERSSSSLIFSEFKRVLPVAIFAAIAALGLGTVLHGCREEEKNNAKMVLEKPFGEQIKIQTIEGGGLVIHLPGLGEENVTINFEKGNGLKVSGSNVLIEDGRIKVEDEVQVCELEKEKNNENEIIITCKKPEQVKESMSQKNRYQNENYPPTPQLQLTPTPTLENNSSSRETPPPPTNSSSIERKPEEIICVEVGKKEVKTAYGAWRQLGQPEKLSQRRVVGKEKVTKIIEDTDGDRKPNLTEGLREGPFKGVRIGDEFCVER